MKTQKLYERDGSIREFNAVVLSCEPEKEGFAVILDRTAFFPEGGGQAGDTGRLGEATVLDTRMLGGELIHFTNRPLPVGDAVRGVLDYEIRFRRMQNHTGEHVVSGIIHRLFGYENVGFHLGDSDVTLDISGELTQEQLDRVELLANEAVAADLPVTVSYPDNEALKSRTYRSKLDLTENVRIVTVGDVDVCACCAPHVATTGQIGVIKLLDWMRYKGGIRLHILCGVTALLDYRHRCQVSRAISRLLSVPQEEISDGVEHLLTVQGKLTGECSSLRRRLIAALTEALPEVSGNRVICEPDFDGNALRELVNLSVDRATGVTVAVSGEDGAGYRYVLGSRTTNLRACAGEINRALGGRGGGTAEMIQGSFSADLKKIREYFITADFSVGRS